MKPLNPQICTNTLTGRLPRNTLQFAASSWPRPIDHSPRELITDQLPRGASNRPGDGSSAQLIAGEAVRAPAAGRDPLILADWAIALMEFNWSETDAAVVHTRCPPGRVFVEPPVARICHLAALT